MMNRLQILFIALLLWNVALVPVELKIDPENSCGGNCNPSKKEILGCCKLKYPSGGYDFIVSTEENCRNNSYFHLFILKDDSLCFEWKEDEFKN